MENTNDANPGKAVRSKRRLFTAGLVFGIAILLCLSAYALYCAVVAQEEITALQAQMDELLQSLAAMNQSAKEERNAEILALQARIDELLQLSALDIESGKEKDAQIEAMQGHIDELYKRTQQASAVAIPKPSVPSASFTDAEIADEETPLTQFPEQAPEEPAPQEPAQADTIVKAGQTISVAVYAPEVKDMYGYELKVYFDSEEIKYNGGLKSSVSAISTIFYKEFDNYVLIGATMVGKKDGYTAEADKTEICSFSFTAIKDCDLSGLSIGGVNVVSSSMVYKENIANWEIEAVA